MTGSLKFGAGATGVAVEGGVAAAGADGTGAVEAMAGSGPAAAGADQRRTPFLDTVRSFVKDAPVRFHCPGHAGGLMVPEALEDLLGKAAFLADVPEVLGMDDLHQPRGALKEAQELAARAYGADATHFLVNGSTCGNQAMILAVTAPGDEILLPRSIHKSVAGALILSGAVPRFLPPEVDPEMLVDHTVSPEAVEEGLRHHPEVRAVLLTSPTYYGSAADLARIADMSHSHEKIFLVDEAWGGHLRFHPGLPLAATDAGADLVVNSTHKMLPSLSQGSMLHQVGSRVDPGRVASAVRMLSSTSPSALLLASLDAARGLMALGGRELLDRALAVADHLREGIRRIPGFRVYGPERVGRPGVDDFDRTRVVFSARDLGLTGFDLERILRYRHNIAIELADLVNVIALVTVAHGEQEADVLLGALREVASRPPRRDPDSVLARLERRTDFCLPPVPESRLSPRDAFSAPHRTVALESVVGRVCAEFVTPYPPGIPLLIPGEVVTREVVEYLEVEREAGVHIQGPADPDLATLRVVEEEEASVKN